MAYLKIKCTALNDQYVDVTDCVESEISMDERLDEVLDSATFTMTTDVNFNHAIEPFTLANLNGTYYYASSQCTKVMNASSAYQHQVILYEITKRLEAFILGSKTLSYIADKSAYNSNYERIRIITELMNAKYNVDIHLDDSIKTKFDNTNYREYSFGAGTTMFDALKEIMANENCIPRLIYNGTQLVLKFDDLGALANQTATSFTASGLLGISSNQNVDEYCSEIETEMTEVVDRDTLQTVTLSMRSQDTVTSTDNACLILPSNCEDIKKLEIYGVRVFTCDRVIKITNLDSSTISTWTESADDVQTYSNCLANIEKYCGSDIRTAVYNYVTTLGINTQHQGLITIDKVECALYFGFDVKPSYYDEDTDTQTSISVSSTEYADVTYYCLNKEQWDLLEAATQPKYLYFESGSNYIEGWFNSYYSNFWKKIVYGEVDPFISNDKCCNIGTYADTGIGTTANPIYIASDEKFFCSANNTSPNDPLNYIYRVTYTTKSPFYGRTWKTDGGTYYASARSYNNGANCVDFDQLMPQMARSANMLGLLTRTIESNVDDFSVGTLTNYGYIISKQKKFRRFDNELISSIVYNCSTNYEQIAQAIAVATQYEATKLPQTGIVTRFVYTEVDSIPYEPYLVLNPNNPGTDTLYHAVKKCQKLVHGNAKYLVCEALDNYGFDNMLTNHISKYTAASINITIRNYYANTPYPYSLEDETVKAYSKSLLVAGDQLETVLKSNLDAKDSTESSFNDLPKVYYQIISNLTGNTSVSFGNIYKDSRERLVFIIKYKTMSNPTISGYSASVDASSSDTSTDSGSSSSSSSSSSTTSGGSGGTGDTSIVA